MLNFIVVENDKVSNLILAESKDSAELISNATCIEYDATLVNPIIGQEVVDGEVVDLEIFSTEESTEDSDSELNGKIYFVDLATGDKTLVDEIGDRP